MRPGLDSWLMQSEPGGASNGTKSCIERQLRVAQTAGSMKVRLLAIRSRQDSTHENSRKAPGKKLPEENVRTLGKHVGSTARHTTHELAQHKFGTRMA